MYILGEKTLTSFWSFDIISSVISEADHGVGEPRFWGEHCIAARAIWTPEPVS